MPTKCPGRDDRDLRSIMVRCNHCGRKVEFFSDEVKRRCRCGKTLLREAIPKCAAWCAAAEACLGNVVDVRKLREDLKKLKEDPRADYVRRVQEQIEKRKDDDER